MIAVLRATDEGWPGELDEGPVPPVDVLHVVGRPLDPDAPKIAVVGTRRPTAAGVQAANEIATGLALEGYTIVSGLAVGIDAAAHRAALDAGGMTIAVLGCGHAIDYPKRNRTLRKQIEAEGTVISEYPPETEPKPWMFPLRNRIIAGLSIATVAVEGTIQSGALVTARLALDANREVFALPGSVRNVMSQGPNELIRRGEAALVTRTEHVIEVLTGINTSGAAPPPTLRAELSLTQQEVLAHLDDTASSVDAISRAIEMAPREVGTAVSMLELSGLAKRTFRGYIVTERGARVRASFPLSGDPDA